MENEIMEFTLPPAPRGLCFDRLDFVKSNFSVDNFLADHQNVTSLEAMRDDLGVYLKVLRLAMIELINKDYANFVNLSATLIGFDKSIEKIQRPLWQLNEEVVTVKQCLEEAMKELSMWLNQRHSLQKKKQLLKYYSQTVKSLTTLDKIMTNISDKKSYEKVIITDRGAMQYNQLKFTISKCESLLKPEQMSRFKSIGETLIQTLNELVFQFWNDNDNDKLLKTLFTLASLDRVDETEALIRKRAVAPLLQDIINEQALQKSKDGLQGIYYNILSLLDTKLKILLEVTQHSKLSFLVKKYKFIVNCFWCEVETRLEVNLASIFAPGIPKIYYRRYSESMCFIKRLQEYCTDSETIKLLHGTAEYKSFQRRWNLPVYFQIRFQEIAGNFEGSLHRIPTLDSSSQFLLSETASCWRALQECWADGVYIEALGHKFWKLTLQLIVRYASWSSGVCMQRKTSPKLDSTTLNKELLNSSINLYVDSQSLLEKLPSLLQTVEGKVPIENKEILRDSMKQSQQNLFQTRESIKKCIVEELFETLNVYLKQVSDIPRLYRKTNRSVPTKPCTYIETVSKTILDFHQECQRRLDNAFIAELYEALFDTMTVAYYKYVEDVLTSVQRTEESLRRLKQIREQAPTPLEGVTDGDKIRLQLNIDVLAYGNIATSVNIEVQRRERFAELRDMVAEVVKNINKK